MNAPVPLSPLHALGQFRDPHVGADRELLDIAALLRGHRPVQLWADGPVHPWYAAQGVQSLRAFGGAFPHKGVLVLGGIHVNLGQWLAHTHFERLVIRYNIAHHRRLFLLIEQLRCVTGLEPHLSFISAELQGAVDLPGSVEATLVRLAPFLAVSRPPPGSRPFTIGRASRDEAGKHHPDDPALYRMLAARGIGVRVMGGTCMAAALAGVPHVELLPAGAEEMPVFLQSLDAFFYRTGSTYETYGRVVVEAMAAALPVVSTPRGGQAALVAHNECGFLAQDQEAAHDALLRLAAEPALRLRMGATARYQALARHGPGASEGLLRPYL
ncbi:MAG: glycosyltransferase [Pseudomonadota bacterium]